MNKGEIAVWLYGSYARGCPYCHSDLDILVAIDSLERANEIEREIKLEFCRASLSCYTWDEISRMAKHGSLFLQHLKLEATPLYETALCAGKLKKILGALGNYRFTHRDLRGFWTVIDDVEEELNNKAEDSYELAVLATVMRHSAILGCWLLDQPSFGRIEPVSRFVRLRGIQNAVGGGFPDLYGYRLYADGRCRKELLRKLSVRQWLERASLMVANVEEVARERDRRLPEATQ